MSKIINNIALSNFSSYKIGGPARYFAEAESRDDLVSVLKQWRKISKDSSMAERVLVLGGGTNVLIDDSGYDGLVIHNKIKDIKILNEDTKILRDKDIKVKIGAGVLVSDILNFCLENSLSGLSWAGGLPGTIGGAVRGNAGAFGGEIRDSIVEVSYISTCEVGDPATSQVGGKIRRRNKDECSFGYRNSIFKTNPNEIIIEAVLSLKKGNKDEIRNQINEKIEYRKLKHPNISDQPNIGSTFKNIPVRNALACEAGGSIDNLPKEVAEEFKDKIKTDPFPVLPAGKLIAGAGLTGERVGDITVSKMHPNFLVNTGRGKSSDVLSLINKIKTAVKKKYEVVLEEEITII